MSAPVRSLPVVVTQVWDCGGGCTECCRQYVVEITDEEKARIESQGWDKDPELAGQPLFERRRGGGWQLRHRPDGGCVFLDADNRCRIHARFGAEAKPFACRLYPFVLVPHGKVWQLGMRYSCPPAVRSIGRRLINYTREIYQLVEQLEQRHPGTPQVPPPLPPGVPLEWEDVDQILATYVQVLMEESTPLERRWRKLLLLNAGLRSCRYDGGGDPQKQVTGRRLRELLRLLLPYIEDKTTPNPWTVEPPNRALGHCLFRSLLAVYVRKDTGPQRGLVQRWWWGRLRAAWRFVRGEGKVPRLHQAIPPGATFDEPEEPQSPLPPEAQEILTRWSIVKIYSGQFCGASNFGLDLWEGVDSLTVAYVAILWLTRLLRAHKTEPVEAVVQAVRIVDDNFGYNPLLSARRQRRILKWMQIGWQLPRLVAWYGRELPQ